MFEDNEPSLPGFQLYQKGRPAESKTKHGGEMIAVSISIRHQPLDIIDEYDIVAWTIYNANEPYHLISFYNPPYDSSNYVWPIDKWKKFLNRVENLATSLNVIALGDATLPKINWDIMDSINVFEADVWNLLNDTRMKQIVNFKTTSTSTLDLVFVNYTVINLGGDYKFDASYSINGKYASNHYSLRIKIPWNYEGRAIIPSVHSSVRRANVDSMNDHNLLQPLFGYC